MQARLPENEAERLKNLCEFQILDTPAETGFDDLTRLAAQICGTPIALISLVDADRQWFKSKVGLDASETPRSVAFCAHAILQTDVFIVPNALADERFATNPLVSGNPHIRFYAGVPLITAEGQAVGTLCTIDYVPRQLEPHQIEALRALGRQVVAQLELRRSLAALSGTITEGKHKHKTRKRFFKRIAGGFGTAAVMVVVIGAIWYRSTTRFVETISSVVNNQQVSEKLEKLSTTLTQAETEERGYLLTGDKAYLKTYKAAIADVDRSIKDLRKLTAKNPQQQQKLNAVEPLIAKRLALLNKAIDFRMRQNFEASLQIVVSGEGKQLVNEIEKKLAKIKNEQKYLSEQQSGKRDGQLEMVAFSIGIILVLAVLAAIYYFIEREITERKQVEEVLSAERDFVSAVLNTAGALIVVLDPQGRIIRFNRACERITSYSFAEVKGKRLWGLFIAKEEVEPVKAIFKQLQKGQFPGESESYWITKDKSRRRISWRSNAIFNTDGSVKYFIAAGIDITERQQTEEALRVEKEKSELLLLNILPSAIVQRLKNQPSSIADSFASVTVLFADIVGFTELSSRVPPIKLVKLLNGIFSTFDLLTEKHGLEKIKTIGDAYMVVGGLPIPRADHALAIADMALDIQQAIADFNAKTGETFSIRIGINTGPVVAGVIGIKKFTYDLWGDTVNTASRMECQGIPGTIQVTHATYELLKDKYLLEERGVIKVKGKGEMMTYLLVGKK